MCNQCLIGPSSDVIDDKIMQEGYQNSIRLVTSLLATRMISY